MDYVVAVKGGRPARGFDLAAALAGVAGVSVRGANDTRAQVSVESPEALARLRNAVGANCHVEEVKPRKRTSVWS